ncbi:hypothetical protein Tco_0970111 [Tanacetum coccineum]
MPTTAISSSSSPPSHHHPLLAVVTPAVTLTVGAFGPGVSTKIGRKGCLRVQRGARLVVLQHQGLRLGCVFMGKGAFGSTATL